MLFDTNQDFLKDLNWPEHAMDRRGAMTWTTILSDDDSRAVKSTASISVEDTTVTLRLDTGTSGGDIRSDLEATWNLDSEMGPVLVHATRNGAPATLDEPHIIREFKDQVSLMGVLPHFQPMAPRNSTTGPRRNSGP